MTAKCLLPSQEVAERRVNSVLWMRFWLKKATPSTLESLSISQMKTTTLFFPRRVRKWSAGIFHRVMMLCIELIAAQEVNLIKTRRLIHHVVDTWNDKCTRRIEIDFARSDTSLGARRRQLAYLFCSQTAAIVIPGQAKRLLMHKPYAQKGLLGDWVSESATHN